jgi:tetratricopeptide (TPR) repeat protein
MAAELSDIDALEEQLKREPGAKTVLEQLLLAYASETIWNGPRRVERIVEYVRLFPRDAWARTPIVAFSPQNLPEGWRRVEQEWQRHLRAHPSDSLIARGFAAFLAESDWRRALDVLRAAAQANPDDPDLITDMGRVCQEPTQRLEFLRRARELGASQPNLLVWLACSSLDAGDLDEAERAAQQLLELAAEARVVHGHRLDFREQGQEFWNKALAECGDRAAAHQLVQAHGDHSNRKHWGHTVRGVVALRRGDVAAALEHLEYSGEVAGEPRLSSYGPSMRLAKELVRLQQWDAVAAYLQACRAFWDSPLLDTWIDDLRQRRAPDFGDE